MQIQGQIGDSLIPAFRRRLASRTNNATTAQELFNSRENSNKNQEQL
jgi:hypothetical protein